MAMAHLLAPLSLAQTVALKQDGATCVDYRFSITMDTFALHLGKS
jgi:hypothetical protein